MAKILSRRTNLLQTILHRRDITMSAQLRAEKIIEEMKEKNPYYEKYASKIAALQQTSPEEFLQRVEKATEKKKPKKEPSRNYSELLRPKQDIAGGSGGISQKRLCDVMKVELIADKTPEEIQHIWLEYHKTKDVIAAAVPVDQYDTMMKRAKEYPLFLFPLPRSEGFEFIMLQFEANTVHFTPLLCYQVHKENAPECLNIVHFEETRDKGFILLRGEYDDQVINGQEAQCLANQLQMYYCKNHPSKLALLEKFTKQPNSFKHMELLNEMENIQLE